MNMTNTQTIYNSHNQPITVNDIVVFVNDATSLNYGIVSKINNAEKVTIHGISFHDGLLYVITPFFHKVKHVNAVHVITNQFSHNHTLGILYSIENHIPLYFNNEEQLHYYLKTELWNMFAARLHRQYHIKYYDNLFISYTATCTNKNISSIYYMLDRFGQSNNIKADCIKRIEKECISCLDDLNNTSLQYDMDELAKIYHLKNFDFGKHNIPTSKKYKAYYGPVIVVCD